MGAALKEGWLNSKEVAPQIGLKSNNKSGSGSKIGKSAWRRLWCVLSAQKNCIYFYKQPNKVNHEFCLCFYRLYFYILAFQVLQGVCSALKLIYPFLFVHNFRDTEFTGWQILVGEQYYRVLSAPKVLLRHPLAQKVKAPSTPSQYITPLLCLLMLFTFHQTCTTGGSILLQKHKMRWMSG